MVVDRFCMVAFRLVRGWVRVWLAVASLVGCGLVLDSRLGRLWVWLWMGLNRPWVAVDGPWMGLNRPWVVLPGLRASGA